MVRTNVVSGGDLTENGVLAVQMRGTVGNAAEQAVRGEFQGPRKDSIDHSRLEGDEELRAWDRRKIDQSPQISRYI